MRPNKRLLGWMLLGVAVAAFAAAAAVFALWQSRAVLLVAIVVEGLSLTGLVVLFVWPEPTFAAGEVNPQLVRCPRCSSTFEPPTRGEELKCPTCGLQGQTPPREAKVIKPSSGDGGRPRRRAP